MPSRKSGESHRILIEGTLCGLRPPSVPHADAGSVMRGSGGVRKVRWSREGTGKSGGVRIVYVTRNEVGEVYLLTLYAKSKSENISLDTLKEIRRALEV